MYTNNISAKLTIPFPYDKPDGNGVVYTEDSVKRALDNIRERLAVVFRSSDCNKTIGMTKGCPSVVLNKENKEFECTFDITLFAGGTCCSADIEDDKVVNFEILQVGIGE